MPKSVFILQTYSSKVLMMFCWLTVQIQIQKHNSPVANAVKTLFSPVKPTNPSVWMPFKGQNSFWITTILYAHWACKNLFWPVKPTNPAVWMSCKTWRSFRKPVYRSSFKFLFSSTNFGSLHSWLLLFSSFIRHKICLCCVIFLIFFF